MTSIYLLYLFKIIWLSTFSEFPSFAYVSFKLSILFNHTENSKKLALYYILPPFIFINSLFTNNKDMLS